MQTHYPSRPQVVTLLSLVSLLLLAGCAPRTEALFTRPELRSYGRLAILGLSEEQEQIFMATYLKTFPEFGVAFLERGRLVDLLGEQDLLRGRLNDRTRAKISQILGVELLFMCNYEETGPAGQEGKLRVRIVDSETGIIVGSVITKAGKDFQQHCQMAAQSLRADLAGKKGFRPAPTTTQRRSTVPMPM